VQFFKHEKAELFYSEPVLSLEDPSMAIVPFETSNRKKARSISLVIIGSHKTFQGALYPAKLQT
jgi:hypothetical protein